MNLRNNNRQIIKDLAKVNSKENKVRNKILIITVVIAFVIILLTLSMLHARYDAYNVGNVRFIGEVSMLKLLAPTDEQEQIIKSLPYVDNIVKEQDLGFGITNGIENARCIYIDEDGFEDQYSLAFTDIKGKYPEKKDEIMVSLRTLAEAGIKKPVIGMKIPISIGGNSNFVLSGYFTDYSEFNLPKVFLSEDYYKSVFDKKDINNYLIIFDTLDSSEFDVKELICEAIGIENNDARLTGEGNFNVYMGNQDNSYAIYILLVAMILLCSYFLINSSFAVTLNKDMNSFARLKTLGATNLQLWNILLRQIIKYSILGILIGLAIGSILVIFLVPFLAEAIHIPSEGAYPFFRAFKPLYLVISILLTFFMAIISSFTSLRKISGLSAMDSKRKAQNVNMRKRVVPISKLGIFKKLAVARWIKARSNFMSIAMPLLLSVLIILCFMTWVRGIYGTLETDLSKEPDFNIAVNSSIEFAEKESGYIDSALEKKLVRQHGVIKSDVTYGEYLVLDSYDEAWQPLLKAYNRKSSDYDINVLNRSYQCAAIALNEKQTKILEEYFNNNDVKMDWDKFKNGKGVLCLNGGRLKGNLKSKGKAAFGKKISISSRSLDKTKKYTFMGYLKRSAKGLPDWGKMMTTFGMPTIIISENGLDRLDLKKQVQDMYLYVDQLQEPRISKLIKNTIDKKNLEISKKKGARPDEKEEYIVLSITSDMQAIYSKMDDGMKIIVWGVTLSLIILTFIQYCSVLVTNMASREKELKIFNSLGMTEKQTSKLLRKEGFVFGFAIVFLLFTVGSGVIWVFGKIGKIYRQYFTFEFLWREMLVTGLVMLVLAILLPALIYKLNNRFFRREADRSA